MVFCRTKRDRAEGRRRARRARLRRRRRPRRPRPGRPRAGAARVPQRQGRRAGRHRRRRPRHRRRGRHARHQLPVPRGREDLPAPDRPHGRAGATGVAVTLRRLGRHPALEADQQGARAGVHDPAETYSTSRRALHRAGHPDGTPRACCPRAARTRAGLDAEGSRTSARPARRAASRSAAPTVVPGRRRAASGGGTAVPARGSGSTAAGRADRPGPQPSPAAAPHPRRAPSRSSGTAQRPSPPTRTGVRRAQRDDPAPASPRRRWRRYGRGRVDRGPPRPPRADRAAALSAARRPGVPTVAQPNSHVGVDGALRGRSRRARRARRAAHSDWIGLPLPITRGMSWKPMFSSWPCAKRTIQSKSTSVLGEPSTRRLREHVVVARLRPARSPGDRVVAYDGARRRSRPTGASSTPGRRCGGPCAGARRQRLAAVRRRRRDARRCRTSAQRSDGAGRGRARRRRRAPTAPPADRSRRQAAGQPVGRLGDRGLGDGERRRAEPRRRGRTRARGGPARGGPRRAGAAGCGTTGGRDDGHETLLGKSGRTAGGATASGQGRPAPGDR